LNPNISGLSEPQLSQKNNKINFGNRNAKNDISHQTIKKNNVTEKLQFLVQKCSNIADFSNA